MNTKYLAPLFCITILALAPACTKRQPSSAKATKGTSKDVNNVDTMIELDNSVFEVEDVIDEEHVVKF
jgi:hypothetical protein